MSGSSGVFPGQKSQVIDRGDPSAVDFDQTALTLDNAFHALDLSAVVPVGAKFVILQASAFGSAAGAALRFRKNGNANARNISAVVIQVASITNSQDCIVPVDTNRNVAYAATATISIVSITIKGWILE